MKQNAVLLSALLLLPAAVSSQEKPQPTPSPSGGPTFPAQVEQVTVDVVVTEKNKGPVLGLTQDDFVVTEDGSPQTIASFEAIQVPATPSATPAPRPAVSTNTDKETQTGRSFVIVFDDVHLTPPQANRAKTAIAQFLKTGAREGDRVTLIASAGAAWWSTRMEAGRDELIAMLKRLDGRFIPDLGNDRVTDYEAMRIHVFRDPQIQQRVIRRFETYGVTPNPSGGQDARQEMGDDPRVLGRAAEVYYAATSRNRITLEVLERVLLGLAPTRGRKSLILVSEGFIYDPNLDDFKRVVQASRRSNCAIYFLDVAGLTGMPDAMTAQFGPAIDTQDLGGAFAENMERAEGAESIAADSGGFSVKNTNDLGKGIQKIADDSRAYYLIGYNPTNTVRDGKFRKIQVKINRKGVDVRARKGYYAALEGKTAVAKKPGAPDPDIQAALDSPYEIDHIPLRMTNYVLDETLLGKATVVLATEVDVRGFQFDEKDGRSLDTIEFLLVAAHRESGEYFRYDQKLEMKLLPKTKERMEKTWVPIVRDFELPPGGYQAKIVVRDANSRKIGTVIHEFEVPDLSQLRTSTPVISDSLQPAPEGEKAVPRPAITARRTFSPGADLYMSYDVYGAQKDKTTGMPKVTAGMIIRKKEDGTLLAAFAPTPIKPTSLGRLSRLTKSSLENATPGDYELVLNVRDDVAGKALELKETFSVQ